MKRAMVLLFVVVFASVQAHGATKPRQAVVTLSKRISHLKEIVVNPGVNNVRFDGIGRDGQIISAASEQCGAECNSQGVFMLTTKAEDDSFTYVIPFDEDFPPEKLTITDDNADQEDEVVKSVRFFNGLFDDKAATFVFVSERDLKSPAFDPDTTANPTRITVYVLNKRMDEGALGGGAVHYFFHMQEHFTARCRYIQADWALRDELLVPLRDEDDLTETPQQRAADLVPSGGCTG